MALDWHAALQTRDTFLGRIGDVPEPGHLSRKYGHSFDQAVGVLAAGQHTLFTLEQACALGIGRHAVFKRAAVGRIHRIHGSVYSLVPPALLTREGRWLAAALACGRGAVLSHASAAWLHGLRSSAAALIDVTVPTRVTRTHEGVRVHRSTTLTEADVTEVNGIPCTTVARTLFDLAEVIDRRGLERTFDQAEILEVLDLTALTDQLDRNPTRSGAHKIHSVLAEHYVGRTPTWSELEEAFLAVSRGVGLEDPEVNAWVDLNDGEPAIRGDFVWRGRRLIVETDGHRIHRTRQAFERDRRRDQRLTVAGWRVIRTTWRQIMYRPAELRRTLVALMRR